MGTAGFRERIDGWPARAWLEIGRPMADIGERERWGSVGVHMSEGMQKRKRGAKHDESVAEDDEQAVDARSELKEDIDDLLDEIDEVLEENAEEFVRNYIQKGGE